MAKFMDRAWKAVWLSFALITVCSAQNVTSAGLMDPSRSNAEARPRIIQAGNGPQSLQSAVSKTPATQLNPASYRIASADEVEGMEQTLEKFAAAFENLSLPQVRQIWPVMDREHEAAFKKLFSAFRESSWTNKLVLECPAPHVTGQTANLQCIETLTYGAAKGKSKQVGPSSVSILLKSESNNWVISDMKGAN